MATRSLIFLKSQEWLSTKDDKFSTYIYQTRNKHNYSTLPIRKIKTSKIKYTIYDSLFSFLQKLKLCSRQGDAPFPKNSRIQISWDNFC